MKHLNTIYLFGAPSDVIYRTGQNSHEMTSAHSRQQLCIQPRENSNVSLSEEERKSAKSLGHRERVWSALACCRSRPPQGCRVLGLGTLRASEIETGAEKEETEEKKGGLTDLRQTRRRRRNPCQTHDCCDVFSSVPFHQLCKKSQSVYEYCGNM